MLQMLDTAWKDHLLAMDHLRSSVGLRGYAQVDPKVEYKREGMRTFELMWSSVGERVTDLIFRMEAARRRLRRLDLDREPGDARFARPHVPPRWPAISKRPSTIPTRRPKIEPIRNRGEHVGRNDPCPCGSGKKFKNCYMRKRHGRTGLTP